MAPYRALPYHFVSRLTASNGALPCRALPQSAVLFQNGEHQPYPAFSRVDVEVTGEHDPGCLLQVCAPLCPPIRPLNRCPLAVLGLAFALCEPSWLPVSVRVCAVATLLAFAYCEPSWLSVRLCSGDIRDHRSVWITRPSGVCGPWSATRARMR